MLEAATIAKGAGTSVAEMEANRTRGFRSRVPLGVSRAPLPPVLQPGRILARRIGADIGTMPPIAVATVKAARLDSARVVSM